VPGSLAQTGLSVSFESTEPNQTNFWFWRLWRFWRFNSLWPSQRRVAEAASRTARRDSDDELR
jgi:hypothetical protein